MNKIAIVFSIIAIVIAIFVFQQLLPGKLTFLPDFSNLNLGPFFEKKNDYSGENSLPKESPDVSNNGNSGMGNNGVEYSHPKTFITSGPAEGEFVKDEAIIVFKFITEWEGDLKDISFEVRVIGLDENWKSINSNAYSFQVLAGDNDYKFQVRAKTREGVFDPSPAERNFRAILSPYHSQVKFITARPGSFPNRIMEVVLRNDGEDVNITGWKISGTKDGFGIPKAIRIIMPEFPQNIPSDLILKNGENVRILGNISPISANFLLNKCSGYLNNIYDFNPELPNNCYRIEEKEIMNFSYNCRRYISGLSYCEAPDPNVLNKFVGDLPCREFANQRLNYMGCFNYYNKTNDFFDNYWYIYSTRNFLAEHDDLELRDENNLLVDRFNF
jgi:hypothetical protein